MTPEQEILEACDTWDITLAGTVEHELAAAEVVALVQTYFTVPRIPWWRKIAWNLGWWLPFLPAGLRRKLFRMIGG